MANKNMSFGGWAFLIGFIVALVFGILGITTVVAWILVILGLVVGFLNISDKETQQFLMSSTVLVIVSALGGQAMQIIPVVGNILNAILILFVPATVVVAIKAVFALAKN